MISNQILQNTIEGLKAISRVEFSIIDTDGKIAATTSDNMSEFEKAALEFVKSPADSQEIQGCQFFKIYDEQQLEYILIAGGAGEDLYMVGKMVAFQIQNLLTAYKERFDKDNFIKNLLLDNLLLVDIYSRSKKLHIEADVRRVVIVIEADNGKDSNALEIVRNHKGNVGKDFVTAVDENNVIIVKELSDGESNPEIDKEAQEIVTCLEKEGIGNVHIAYGTIIGEIKEVSRSYKEAKMSLEVAEIFYSSKTVITYEELGIGRLIYQLPTPLCEMFLKEVFGEYDPSNLDDEILTTVYQFMENSLNLSETSRQLFVHRNTLVYRLEKLQKTIGLDIRQFEDAMTFKIAMVVSDYMRYLQTKQR